MTGEIGDTIWCFTTDPAIPCDYCNPIHEQSILEDRIKLSLESVTGENKDRDYRGSQHYTKSGHLCQEWNS
jgi:hypothetical protein